MHFNFFMINSSIGKFMFKSNFALLSSFQVKFEMVLNGSKIISLDLNMV